MYSLRRAVADRLHVQGQVRARRRRHVAAAAAVDGAAAVGELHADRREGFAVERLEVERPRRRQLPSRPTVDGACSGSTVDGTGSPPAPSSSPHAATPAARHDGERHHEEPADHARISTGVPSGRPISSTIRSMFVVVEPDAPAGHVGAHLVGFVGAVDPDHARAAVEALRARWRSRTARRRRCRRRRRGSAAAAAP